MRGCVDEVRVYSLSFSVYAAAYLLIRVTYQLIRITILGHRSERTGALFLMREHIPANTMHDSVKK